MASIKFSRKEFEEHIKLTREVEEKISLMGTHLESLTDTEIEIEVMPNRPDLLSLQGFIRAFKAYLDKEPGLKKYKIKKSDKKLIVDKSLPPQWPYAYACCIRGITFDDAKIKQIIDMQEKLGTTLLRKRKKGGIGIYPLNKIHFPVRFLGMHPDKIKFRPLEYPEAITGRQILSKHPTGREYAKICGSWDTFPVFIDAKDNIMSMPPIINSQDMGKIDETTTDIFLEATGTDSSVLLKAINIIATALAESGGTIEEIECKQQKGKSVQIPDLSPETMKLSLEHTNKLLGLELKEKDLEKLLPRMGYDYKNGTVKVPAWRTDILHEVDLIEDVAIAYGYNNLIPEIPNIATIGEESHLSQIQKKIADILTGLSLLEVSSYHLIKENELFSKDEKIELENSKTEYKLLRPSLLIPALRILSENKDNEYPQKIFEIGTVFSKNEKSETGIVESQHLIIASSPANFTELKQILDYLLKMLNTPYTLKESSAEGFIEGRTASIVVNNENIGNFGELHPETLRAWNIKMPVVALEISLDSFY